MIVNVTNTITGEVIPTCSVHLMGPCPCRGCNGEGVICFEVGRDEYGDAITDTEPCDRCDGDGCDPDVRNDYEDEA